MDGDYQPELRKLLRHVSGAKRNDCAVIIACADPSELLIRHLGMLTKQTTKAFDVILIGSLPKRVPKGLNIINYNEAYPLGSAGGFGVGRVLAYSLGYECLITADTDCFPYSHDLIEKLKLKARQGQKAVLPKSEEYEGSRISHITNQYGLLPRSVVERVGFEYFRLYRGSEDYDMFARLDMEGAIAELDSAKVRHKTHGLNYITLLKAGGDKYVYYKRSVIMASIMLAYYALARLRFARFLGYSAKALGGMAVTQLFYSRYPEIIIASQDALLLNVDAVSAPREAPLPTIQIRRGMRKVLLLTEAEKCSAGGAAIRFKENVSGLRRIFYLAAKVAEAVAAKGDYLAPSPEFIRQYEFLLSWLMHAKPVLYLDNVAYSSGTTKWQFLSNAVKTALLTLVYAIVLPFSILKVATVAYPPKVGNMRHNLEKFREYLQRMDAERKQPAKPLR